MCRDDSGLSIFAFSAIVTPRVSSSAAPAIWRVERADHRLTANERHCILVAMVRAAGAAPREELDALSDRESRDPTMDANLDEKARAAIGGDPSALRKFLGAAAPIVRRVCASVMGRDHADLEDAIQ